MNEQPEMMLIAHSLGRRAFLRGAPVALLGLLATHGLGACFSGQPNRLTRVGYLGQGPGPLVDEFREGLQQLGYVEGANLILDYRFGPEDQYPELVADLGSLRPDVILAANAGAARAALAIPNGPGIVVVGAGDLVSVGLVESLARPGDRITGLTTIGPQLSGKRLELLRDLRPGLARAAVLWQPSAPLHRAAHRETQAAAGALGLELVSLEFAPADDLAALFQRAVRDGAEGIVVFGGPQGVRFTDQIVGLAAQYSLPAVYPLRSFVVAGGLLSYGPDLGYQFQRAAQYVDKILRGAKPSTLPVEQPTRFEFVLNVTAAQAIGLVIPWELLLDATEVIQ